MKTVFKSTLQLLAISCLFVGMANSAVAGPSTKDVAIGLNDVYVPGGFDSQADTYVVASGLFPNGCYSWSRADVKHVDTFTHEIRPYASVSQGMCIMVLIPFNKEIRLGKLATGSHNLRFVSGDGTYLEKMMKIE